VLIVIQRQITLLDEDVDFKSDGLSAVARQATVVRIGAQAGGAGGLGTDQQLGQAAARQLARIAGGAS